MKVLFLVRDLPDATGTGYKKRNYYLVEALKKRGVDVHELMCTGVYEKSSVIHEVMNMLVTMFVGIPFSVQKRTSQLIKKDITDYIQKTQVDVIICDSIYRALNIPWEAQAKKILYEHNIESKIIRRYMQTERNIFKKFFAYLECEKFEQFEKKMWAKFDYCIACSDVDKKIIEAVTSKNNTITVDNGVDTQYFNPDSYPVERNTLVYTGQIGWYPNEDALVYFIEEIMPMVNQAIPEVKVLIVGDKPSNRIKELSQKDSRITVTGFVDDVREFMGKASVYIVPLRIGSGTRLKILEAMSMKKAIVTTSIGCEGLRVEDGKQLLIRDDPRDFADAVLSLLKDENLRRELGNNGRKLVEEKYDWKVVFKDLDKIWNT